MADSRPRPEYGEYATPEEQARAMGRNPLPVPVPDAAASPGAEAGADAAGSLPAPDPTTRIASSPALVVPQQSSFANRVFTIFLLGIGGLLLLDNIPGFLNFQSSYAKSEKLMEGILGTQTVAVPASVGHAGIWILVANIVIYLATILWAARALRRGRGAAYIPVLGFIVFVLVACILIASFAPGYIAELSR